MLSEEKLLGLVGRIYDAAADTTLWPAFLEDFANAVDATTTAIVYHDLQAQGAQVNEAVRFDPEYWRLYVEYYSGIDEWKTVALARFGQDGSIFTGDELLNLAKLEGTEFYNDFLLPQDIIHEFGGIIAKRRLRYSCFTCLRPRNKGPFGDPEVALLRSLFPHLQRAMQFHRKVAELEGQHRASLDAMDRLATGIIFLDDRGRVLDLNRAARRVLDQNDGLTAGKDGLAASNPEQTRKLRAMVVGTVSTTKGNGLAPGGEIGISRPSGKRPFALLVSPTSVEAFPPDARRPAAIVFVTDPEEKAQTGPGVLTRIYNLTAAESGLAELLMQGETLVHVGERLGISHNTARTHLQRIYEKTDTRHQGDLIRLLLAGAGRVVHD